MPDPESRGLPRAVPRHRVEELFRADLACLAELQLGVATSAFQTEGGLDGRGEPETHWAPWAAEGRIERIGPACDLWRRYDEAARRCRAMGLRVFRVGVEWARVAPHGESLDARAVGAYADRLARVLDAGLTPLVTLHHFTHPAWLGEDLWLDQRAPEIFARHAAALAGALGDALVARGCPPVARWITLNEPNMLALATYVAGVFPHGERALAQGDPLGLPRALRALDHLMAAHARAYRAVHAVYAERAWPRPELSANLNFVDAYALTKLPTDLLRAPALGVAPRDLGAHAAARGKRFETAFLFGERSPRADAARRIAALLGRVIAPEIFEATLGAAYVRPAGPLLDYLAVDVYDPWSFHQARGGEGLFAALEQDAALSVVAAQARAVRLAEPWEWAYEPDTFVRALRAMHDPEATLPIDVMENGMALERPVGRAVVPRADGLTRPEYLRGYLFAVAYARAVVRLPVRAYCYWTLVDNYELGRWAPRFGLYGLGDPTPADRAATWSETDAAGDDAAAALGCFAHAVAAGRADPRGMARTLRVWFGLDAAAAA